MEENGGVLLPSHIDIVWPPDKLEGLNRLFMVDLMSRVEMMMLATDESCTFL